MDSFKFPAALPRVIVVRADVQVKTSDGQVGRHTVYQRFNAERTKANANVTLGYSGATVALEKVDGKWRAVRLTNQWIT